MSLNPVFIYPIGDGYKRFSENGFCPQKPYKNFFDGICLRFLDSVFYIHIIQCALISVTYYNGNRGKFWKILLIASIAGCLGTIFENFTVVYVCREKDLFTKRYHIVTFLIAEVFWIIIDYSIPYINLYKIKIIDKGKMTKFIEYIIKTFFLVFVGSRLFIGYERMMNGLLTTPKTKYGHMTAFSVMAIANSICTVTIICYVRRNNHECPKKTKYTVHHYIKRSSYLTLVCIDIVTVILAIFNGITEFFRDRILGSYLIPFNIIKCSFILILALDTLIFKYNIHITISNHGFSNNYKFENESSAYTSNSNNTALKSIAIHNDTSRSINNINKTLSIISSDITNQE